MTMQQQSQKSQHFLPRQPDQAKSTSKFTHQHRLLRMLLHLPAACVTSCRPMRYAHVWAPFWPRTVSSMNSPFKLRMVLHCNLQEGWQ